ncbi:MAG TPA: hypothetical protein PK858_12405, partial [Saprospiraceae bacterium]|nr:hypothetical protein [Saprospiraceae bacterium]
MKRRLLYYAFLVLTGWISFSQCKKGESPYTVPIEPDTAPPPPSGLIGTWIEANTSLFGGSIYQLEFFADSSFRHRLYKYTDIYTTPQDSCNHTHTQYVKGAFWAKDGYLRLTGKYCDANYKKETP